MRVAQYVLIAIVGIFLISCASLKPATVIRNGEIRGYKYFFISPTTTLSSSSGVTIETQYYASSKMVKPSDVIAGVLSKYGLIRMPEVKPYDAKETLVVNYGESGWRSTGLGGYTIEVTIQFIAADSSTLISSCSAEGQGETEADDIRKVIYRCLSALLSR